jgi:hypothetical protein
VVSERNVVLDLGDDGRVAIAVEVGSEVEFVSDDDNTVVASLDSITKPIARVGRDLLDAAKAAKPDRATVEAGFGVALEQGQLVSWLAKGRGEATIKITLEWSSGDASS